MTAKRRAKAPPGRQRADAGKGTTQPPRRARAGGAAAAAMVALLVVAGAWAYGNSFDGVFVMDDLRAVVENETIVSLRTALTPPGACTVTSRPIANLSLAVNYALASPAWRDVFRVGTGPRAGSNEQFLANLWGYHLLNLVIHLAAAVLLMACVRRTLSSPRLAGQFGPAVPWLALAVALIWVVHPLQTESVTYIVQRVESLMAFFYLLTLYCSIRVVEAATATAKERRARRLWIAAAILACAAGMATKEAMVTAPLIVALWAWTFAAPDRKPRWVFLAGLASTWLLLALLMWHENRAPSIDLAQATVAGYLLTQAGVILHYVRLAVVPAPLVILYTWPLVPSFGAAAVPVLLVGLLVALTVLGTVRRAPIAFAGAWFFLILAPTSSVLPIVTEVAAEHRMYLPLAALIAVAVIGAFLAGRWALGRMNIAGTRRAPVIAAIVVLAVVVACGTVTRARNADYVSDETLWRDAVRKQPDNHRARVYYGVALMNGGRFREAEAQFVESLRLRPSDPVALGRLGAALAAQGRFDEAIDTWEKSLALEPDDYATQRYLGEAYAQRRQDRQALRHLERALTAHPDDARLLDFVATLLADSSDPAVRDAPRALALASHAAVLTGRRDAHVLDVLAVAQAGVGQFREAAATADEALALARQQGNARLVTELEYRASAFRARAGS